MKIIKAAILSSLIITSLAHADTFKERIVTQAMNSQTEAVVPEDLHRKLVECQYDYIVDQYGPNISNRQLKEALKGLVTFHHFEENFDPVNPMQFRDYNIIATKCAEKYEEEINELSY